MAPPAFTIVLCTRNRSALLRHALESVLEIAFPPDQFEVCLVDNDSSDDTAEVVRGFAEGAPFAVRYYREMKIGLSAARNRGIREAAGQYLFFTDDDQLVDPGVLREHLRVAGSHSARVIQGAIELTFSSGRPRWLRGPLTTVLGQTHDLPEGPAAIDLFGGNMVLRRDVFDELPGFREDLGKGAAGYCEDVELSRRLRQRGETIVFAPTARVCHVIGPDRATAGFLRRNSFEKGYSDGLIVARARRRQRALRSVFGAATQGAVALLALPLLHQSILAQTRAIDHVGRLVGLARAAQSEGAR